MKTPSSTITGRVRRSAWQVVVLLTIAGALLPVNLAFCATAAETAFYVSPDGNDAWSGKRPGKSLRGSDGPFATLHRAVEAVREARSGNTGSAHAIYLRSGTYFLHRPLELTADDSNLRMAAYRDEKPIISAGRRIDGWRQLKLGTNQVWAADLAEAASGEWEFLELWVNGRRAVRARHPSAGYLPIADLPDKTAQWTDGQTRFRYREQDLDKLRFTSGADAVVMTRWVESRLPVIGVNRDEKIINFAKRSVFQLSAGDLYYLEGALEMMDVPGEWAFDEATSRIYYYPRPGERLRNFEAIAPVLTHIIKLNGEPRNGRTIENLRLEGLTFSHSEWNFPSGFHEGKQKPTIWPPPNPEVGGFAQAAVGVPGAVWGAGVRNSAFVDCAFQNLGNYALELGRGCSGNVISNCVFAHLGAGGIRLGESALRTDPREQSGGNTVTDCVIQYGGRLFHSAIGIWIGQSPNNRITHNLIHDFYYTGISVGWTWGYGPALATNNLIAFNHVHHIGVQSDGDGPILSDMGGIYTLGMQPGTRVINNLWHDIAGFRYGGWGIYFDEGSSSILAESNVVYRTTHGGFHQHYGATNTVRNNIFAFARDHQVQRSRQEPHISFSFVTNIVLFDSGVLLGSQWNDDKFRLDGNIYWDTRSPGEADMKFPGGTLQQWRQKGHDLHSVVSDPGFIAPEKGYFRLRPESPALKMGFQPIDVGKVGPRRPISPPRR